MSFLSSWLGFGIPKPNIYALCCKVESHFVEAVHGNTGLELCMSTEVNEHNDLHLRQDADA